MTSQCLNCGKIIIHFKRQKRKYCSPQCRDAYCRVHHPKRAGVIKVCLFCGKAYYVPAHRALKSKCCSPSCRGSYVGRMSREKISAKMTGRGKGSGYRKFLGRHMHRIVAEQMLGRALYDNEIVHHINGNKRDNRPENLQVMTQSEHCKLHRFGDLGLTARGKVRS